MVEQWETKGFSIIFSYNHALTFPFRTKPFLNIQNFFERGKTKARHSAHACNSSTWGGKGGWITRSGVRDQSGQHSKTLSVLKIQKINWVWWCTPVIPATPEAEVGECEPKRLQWAEIMPLHPSLGNRKRLCLQKASKQTTTKITQLKTLLGLLKKLDNGMLNLLMITKLLPLSCKKVNN